MSADSTRAEPPTPNPINESPPSAKPSFLQKLKIKQSPPITYDTQKRNHRRSNSFTGLVSRILPAHRDERGYTIRKHYDKNSDQDPVELVFGVSRLQDRDGQAGGIATSSGGESGGRTLQIPRDPDDKQTSGDPDGGNISVRHSGGRDAGITHDGSYSASWGRRFGLKRAEDMGQFYEPPDENESKIPLLSAEKDSPDSKAHTQKMFEDKKARRDQRRSLRQSGDFLGVQGANPRTGLWDMSSGTSSTEPSQMSEETKKKLDEEVKNIEEQKKRYEEAKIKHETELIRVQTLRDNKKVEKEKRKKMELKMKQRRHGKWKLSEEGWHSLAEPELSPIIQSVAGSPGKETAPGDRLFPMPTAEDPTPYVNPNNIGPQDYFGHRLVSSPLAKERLSVQSTSPDSFRSSTSIPRKPVGSPTRRNDDNDTSRSIQRKSIGSPSRRKIDESTNTIVHTASAANPAQNEHPRETSTNGSNNIIRKGIPAEQPSRNERQIGGVPQHIPDLRNDIPRVDVTLDTQPLGDIFPETKSPSQKLDSFLDRPPSPWGPECFKDIEATVTLFQSILTNQAETPLQSDPSPKATSPGKRYNSLKDFPLVTLRDPLAARIPLNSRPAASIWAPPTILSSPRRLTPRIITIPTTTTTGSAQLLQPLRAQFDGRKDDQSEVRGRHPILQRKPSQIPLRTTSLPNNKQQASQSTESQVDPAGIAISSEHLLASTKQRTAESCRTISPEGEKVVVKNTPIFISTSQPTHQMVSPAARIAFLSPFQNLRHRAAMKKAEAQNREDSLTPPKLRKAIVEVGNISPKAKVARGGHADTEDPFKTNVYDACQRLGAENAKPIKQGAWEDSLVVWHPSPNSSPQAQRSASSPPRRQLTSDEKYGIVRCENGSSLIVTGGSPRAGQNSPSSRQNGSPRPKTEAAADGKQLVRVQVKKKSSTKKGASPKSATPRLLSMQDISTIAFQIVHPVWFFVKPAFDPKSGPRKRWDAGRLTLQDMVLFAAAAAVVVAVLLLTVLGLRVLIMGLQIGSGFWNVFRILTGV